MTEKILIAIVSAVLSLLTGYILFQVKERREPRKRLSYDLETQHGLLTIDESIARDVALTYKCRAAEKLTFVRCDVRNTGNSVIKIQYLRFDFGAGTQVLDAYIDPIPPQEYGISEVSEPTLSPSQRRYLIKHIEKQQQMGFRFVLTDSAASTVNIIPFNEEGDVEVTAASISRAADDRERVEQFVYLFVLSLIFPPALRFLPGYLGDIAVALAYGVLATAMLFLLKPFSRSVATALANFGRNREPEISFGSIRTEQGGIAIATGNASASVSCQPDQQYSSGPGNTDSG